MGPFQWSTHRLRRAVPTAGKRPIRPPPPTSRSASCPPAARAQLTLPTPRRPRREPSSRSGPPNPVGQRRVVEQPRGVFVDAARPLLDVRNDLPCPHQEDYTFTRSPDVADLSIAAM